MNRFFDKIDMTDSCWLWKGALSQGYGIFKIDKKTISAHRFSYQIHKGEIPEGVFVCHSCDIRNCVNPNHLFLGSPKDNWQDGFDKGRIKLLGGIDTSKLKKHPSKGAYNRGCRCNECKAIQNMMVKRYRCRLK
jgi:hypothetical protein